MAPTQWTGLLPIEPGADTEFAKDVRTFQQNGRVVGVMTDGASATGGLELLFGWLVAKTLKKIEEREKS
jgi:hypothetical protein